MFYLMTKRRINLVRLIFDFIIATIVVEKKKHASLPYGMFLTKVFNKAQLPLAGESSDDKRPTIMIKTFQTMGLKPKAQDKEKEKERKKKKNAAVATEVVVPSTKKSKSKAFDEGKKKKKTRKERTLSPIPEERRSNKKDF